jgi:hypothetical protein
MSAAHASQQPKPDSHEIDFSVDGEPLETSEHELTARQVLALAGIDATTHYLVQIEGRHQIPYQDDPDAVIHMHEGIKFISVSTGPTPVS